MTFSLAARCAATGAFGVCAATADLAVGGRVAHVEAGVGAVLTQHRTDPRLGPRGLALLRSGCGAAETIEALVASTPEARWRQLAVVDRDAATAAFNGDEIVTTSAEQHGAGCVAIGNMLASAGVGAAMVQAFTADGPSRSARTLDLIGRCLAALAPEHDGGNDGAQSDDAAGDNQRAHRAALLRLLDEVEPQEQRLDLRQISGQFELSLQ